MHHENVLRSVNLPKTSPVITSYAERLLSKSLTPSPPVFNPGDWFSTGEAAKLTGYSQRHIRTLCEQGFFTEGTEWRQRPPRPGADRGGHIHILRAALARLADRGGV